jgi:hypothetical protein
MSLIAVMAATLMQTAPAPLPVAVPTVEGVAADPTCGGRTALTTIATCVTTTQGAAEAVMEAFDADFRGQGWLAADGSGNRVVYVRRRETGGCDAFQVMAFDGDQPEDPAAPAYLALASIPGDACQ